MFTTECNTLPSCMEPKKPKANVESKVIRKGLLPKKTFLKRQQRFYTVWQYLGFKDDNIFYKNPL